MVLVIDQGPKPRHGPRVTYIMTTSRKPPTKRPENVSESHRGSGFCYISFSLFMRGPSPEQNAEEVPREMLGASGPSETPLGTSVVLREPGRSIYHTITNIKPS